MSEPTGYAQCAGRTALAGSVSRSPRADDARRCAAPGRAARPGLVRRRHVDLLLVCSCLCTA
ncbi:hypothetical protein VSR01_02675 [Actinacidiphila sp. DG2A-62]|uniref:hypothetical protein n=1 Tax=Actinacidiphila sp. DG2A-62 TaxID=3108821 RepID=UPI002DBD9ECD|nr:hypothetical protein [Actinacidiphila sp. DG2A-62]MEC3992507.1 hypothetical protein [Actinacidiphila sp. DG2A-62]